MAIGDIGLFLPKESTYKSPTGYEALLEAEAVKRGTWLAQMDQFYAQLEESQRQFDENLGFQEETRDIEVEMEKDRFEFEKESFGKEIDLKERAFSFEQESFEKELALKEKALDVTARGGETIHLGRTPEETYDPGAVTQKDTLNFLTNLFQEEKPSSDASADPLGYFRGFGIKLDEIQKQLTRTGY